MTRILLFLATNAAVMLVFSITSRLLGIDRMLGPGNYQGLFLFALIAGFAGSLISLAMSKSMAKRGMGVHVIEEPANETERWLRDTVYRQAEQAGIGQPEVGIFNSPQPNAFATGMNRNSSLIAVSTGLLEHMQRDEVEAVLGHEVGHAANGDMVTMGLVQGVLNTFVIFFARIIGQIAGGGRDGQRGNYMVYMLVSMAAEFILGILASFIAAWFSRRREFVADRAGADLASRDGMINALKALQRVHDPEGLPASMAAFGILGGRGSLMRQLASTHPPLEERIAALEAGR